MSAAVAIAGEGWRQLWELGFALLLSASVGLEREIRQKSAGLRTNTLVGLASALFMIVSKHGFDDVLAAQRVVLDPSRIAAQIVSGIGFIGGGVIFMRRDVVRGLTTAASVWLTAAIGMSCGAGLPVLAVATVAGHFLIMLGFPRLLPLVAPATTRPARVDIRVAFTESGDTLASILRACSETGAAASGFRIERDAERDDDRADRILFFRVRDGRKLHHLLALLSALRGVVEAGTVDEDVRDLD